MSWQITVEHEGLHKIRVIRGEDRDIVEQKAMLQREIWDEMWSKRQEIEKKRQEREKKVVFNEDNKQLAIEKTKEAEDEIESLRNILKEGVSSIKEFSWDVLLDKSHFPEPGPARPVVERVDDEPKMSWEKYQPKTFFITNWLFPNIKVEREKKQ